VRIPILIVLISVANFVAAQSLPTTTDGKAWTFTYLKALQGERENLKKFIQRNWFIMDSIANRQGLIDSYKLLESMGNAEYDFSVVVVYHSPLGYEAIKESFEKIRISVPVTLVDGKGLKALGKIVKSETTIETANNEKR
jgi:hypothetical protein